MSEALVARPIERFITLDDNTRKDLVEAAKLLAETALQRIEETETSTSNTSDIQRTTLRHEDGTLFQITKRDMSGNWAGGLRISTIRTTHDESGIPQKTHATLELPRVLDAVTGNNLSHLMVNRSNDMARSDIAQYAALREQLSTAHCVSDNEFVIPIQPYRQQFPIHLHPVESVKTHTAHAAAKVTELVRGKAAELRSRRAKAA